MLLEIYRSYYKSSFTVTDSANRTKTKGFLDIQAVSAKRPDRQSSTNDNKHLTNERPDALGEATQPRSCDFKNDTWSANPTD
ncbi:hypothetical protein PGT21_002339 [Puccinia graminis f. sp. tritici]|uniref:Uncharacterized protein n=1 Tax=Puccinia graminis f. sp. tritici TaxID=56615 RepID=A0A5B0QE95_PUCGR|nr:hypothetical protein PGT21_002339 [Puccinia graminis f. sp. tritici]